MRPLLLMTALCVAGMPMTGHTPAAASSSPVVKQAKRNGRPSQQQQKRLERQRRMIQQQQRQWQRARLGATDIDLKGAVLLPDSTPAANAEVIIGWQTYRGEFQVRRLKTDAQGKFAKHLQPNPGAANNLVTVAAYLPGKGFTPHQTLQYRSEKKEPLTLKMQAPISLTGRMVNADGTPAASARVRVNAILPAQNNTFIQFAEQQLMMTHIGRISGQKGYLSKETLDTLYTTRTDVEGRFTIAGLPPNTHIQIDPPEGLLLTPGSAMFLRLFEKNQNAGLLTVTPPARLTVRTFDRKTGKPLSDTPIHVSAAERGSIFAGLQARFQDHQNLIARQSNTGTNGECKIEKLYPGEYNIGVQHRIERVRLEPGRETTLDLSVRHGDLKGRLVDANGKPLIRHPIYFNAGFIMKTPIPGAEFGEFSWEKRPRATTDVNGEFVIPQFPYESAWVTIRADKGNDRAEFHGTSDKIGETLTLKMKKDALITVTGRLIDPKRRPIQNASFLSVHWQPSPRAIWVSNAREFQVDAEGRFRVTGMERGEAFSFITSPNQRFVRPARMDRRTGKAIPASMPFESPRFTTPPSGAGFDLGDVMIHPSDEPEEIQTAYGISPNSFSDSPGFLPEPTEPDVAAAKQAWTEYQASLAAGKVEEVYRLTSPVSPGWSEDRREFLLRTALRPTSQSEQANDLYALRFVPRGAALMLMTKELRTNLFQGGNTALERELDANLHWVFLAEKRDKTLVTVAALRQEEDGWRVVTAPETILALSLAGNSGLSNIFAGAVPATPDPAKLTVSAPKLDIVQTVAAQKVGVQFLQHWAQDRVKPMMTLTSNRARFGTTNEEQYRQRLKRRVDKGHCPLAPAETVELTPMTDLSQWELEWLTVFSQMQASNRQFAFGIVSDFHGGDDFIIQSGMGFPTEKTKHGELAVFRYKAEGKTFLMVLIQEKAGWKMVEPALLMWDTSKQHLAMR